MFTKLNKPLFSVILGKETYTFIKSLGYSKTSVSSKYAQTAAVVGAYSVNFEAVTAAIWRENPVKISDLYTLTVNSTNQM